MNLLTKWYSVCISQALGSNKYFNFLNFFFIFNFFFFLTYKFCTSPQVTRLTTHKSECMETRKVLLTRVLIAESKNQFGRPTMLFYFLHSPGKHLLWSVSLLFEKGKKKNSLFHLIFIIRTIIFLSLNDSLMWCKNHTGSKGSFFCIVWIYID